MSIAGDHVTCSGCDFEAYLEYRPVTLIYQFSDGTEVESTRAKGWCEQCENISDIEGKIIIEPLRTRLVALQNKTASMSFLIANLFSKLIGNTDNVKREIAAILGQLQLAQAQGDRSRCLKCGGVHTQPIAFNNQDVWIGFVHDCGGQFRLAPIDPEAPRFSYRPETIYLDQDGLRT